MRHKHFHPFTSVYCLIVLGSTKLVQMSNSKHPRASNGLHWRNITKQTEKYCKAVDCLIVLVSDNKQHLLGLSTGLHWHHSRMRPKDPRVPACYKHYITLHYIATLPCITLHFTHVNPHAINIFWGFHQFMAFTSLLIVSFMFSIVSIYLYIKS